MYKRQLPHIFEEFSREHTTTENKVAGTGLGLPIVKSMIELMGGSIQVESTQGVGTKFTVDISFDMASESDVYRDQISEQPDVLEKLEGKRILLAEDNDPVSYTHLDVYKRQIQDVLKTTGITATAGIGTNMYLCKIAMDIVAKHIKADKDGVRIAELDEMSYRRKLWSHRPLTDFWRVGKGYAKKLEEYGLYTCLLYTSNIMR